MGQNSVTHGREFNELTSPTRETAGNTQTQSAPRRRTSLPLDMMFEDGSQERQPPTGQLEPLGNGNKDFFIAQ
jgi:hypothetical protein